MQNWKDAAIYVEADVADDAGRIVHRLQNVQHTGHRQRIAAKLHE